MHGTAGWWAGYILTVGAGRGGQGGQKKTSRYCCASCMWEDISFFVLAAGKPKVILYLIVVLCWP